MKRWGTSTGLAAATVLFCGIVSSQQLVIEHVHVIPMTGDTLLLDRSVVIDDGKILTVVDGDAARPSRRALRIDGTGKYLVPGLCDLHVHFNGGSNSNPDMLALYLANGVTTVLNMRGSKGILELREQVRNGKLLGPEIFTTGPIIGNTSADPKTAELGREMVQQFHAEGYDFIKVYNQIPEEGYRGIMEAAKQLHIPVVGHAVRSVGVDGALASGQHIAHMEEIIYGYFRDNLDEARIPELAARFKDADIAVIATLTAFHNIIKQVEDLNGMLRSPGMEYLHPRITRSWQPETNEYTTRFNDESVQRFLGPSLAFQQKLLKAFTDADVRVLIGTDASIPIVIPGYSTHQELEEFVAAGVSPYAALAAGTVRAQRFLGRNDVGTIEAGMRACLVLLDANPLEDITNSRKIAGVVLKGQWLDRAALQAALDKIQQNIAESASNHADN